MKHRVLYLLLGEAEDKFRGLCSYVVFKQGIDCGPVHGETVSHFFRKAPVLGALQLTKKIDIICNILFEVWHISLTQPASSGGQQLTGRDMPTTAPFSPAASPDLAVPVLLSPLRGRASFLVFPSNHQI